MTPTEAGALVSALAKEHGLPLVGYAPAGPVVRHPDFVAWDRPVPQPCPICNAKFVVKKENRQGIMLRCLECDWKQGADESEENAA